MADDPATDAQKKALYWIGEIESAEKWRRDYWKRAKRIIQRYQNDDWTQDGNIQTQQVDRRFAILWSNVQTLGPAVYAKTPQPIVTRRFKDPDPVARVASEVLERACAFTLDQCDFDSVMVQGRNDYLLIGQGVDWIRYVPKFKPLEAEATPGEEAAEGDVQISNAQDDAREELLDYEEVIADHVSYDDFLTNPARSWAEVWWVSRRAFLTRDQLIDRFGKKLGRAIPLDYDPTKAITVTEPDQQEKAKKGCVYEIWNARTRTVCWVSRGYNKELLDEREDPLGLSNFFPCPRPLLATCTPLSIIPIPDYVYYQDQAEEIDDLTARIGVLSDALQVHGMYDAEHGTDLANVFSSPTNYMIPVASWAMLKEGGGIKGAVEWFPIEQVADGLRACVEMRKQLLDDVYQLTGISDIQRGDTDPDETAKAQGLKAQFGNIRVRDKQKEIARYARDTIRLIGEVIAEKFAPETLAQMTGVKLFPTMQAKQQAEQQVQMLQQAAQQGLPVPPVPQAMQEMLKEPTWEEVLQLLRSNAKRAFQVDIETDSTIEPDEAMAKKAFVEFGTMFSGLMTAALPVLSAFPKAAPLFAEMAKEGARLFRVSRTMEEVIEQVFDEVAQMPPVPQQQKPGPPPPDPAEQQAKLITASANQTKAQASMLTAQANAATDQTAHQLEQQRTMADVANDVAEQQLRTRELDLKEEALKRDPKPQGVA
jgi:hypothetical protein